MTTLLTIGEFSRLTHLSVKALRHYHDLGLLDPADVDPDTGYRFYAAAQAPTAQLIRRFRDMDMPLEQIKAVLAAADPDERDRVIIGHLRSMERQLEQTQATVASLRALLEGGGLPLAVEFRTLAAGPALMARDRVGWNDVEHWLHDTLTDLRRQLDLGADRRSGPDGALYSTEFFEAHIGEVIAFVPLAGARPQAAPQLGDVPGGPVAVTVHRGPFDELDRAYAALGTFVNERGIGTRAPIRENYVVSALDGSDGESLVTEVCWPLSHSRAG
jgi:DNA-binding transcriptional MerR regulator/effector-binding domain-containing protein